MQILYVATLDFFRNLKIKKEVFSPAAPEDVFLIFLTVPVHDPLRCNSLSNLHNISQGVAK